MPKNRAQDSSRKIKIDNSLEKMGGALGFYRLPGSEKHPVTTVIGKGQSFTPGAGHIYSGQKLPFTGAIVSDKPKEWQGAEGLKGYTK